MAVVAVEPRSAGKIGVVGLGYVGLPLAASFAEAGMTVVGVDTDVDKISALDAGESYVADVPAERLAPLIASGKMRFTKEHAALKETEAVFICLPTPLTENREPDLSALVSGVRAVAPNLSRGALVVLESTTYPGSTREVLLPILEDGGRRVGEHFNLAYSPERIDPGNSVYDIRNTPRVVGGITPKCARRAREIYDKVVEEEVYEVSSPETAEMAKLLENVFRSVNIALVNELAIICGRMGVDVWEVVQAAGTKPFGFMSFSPGPGLGGHCLAGHETVRVRDGEVDNILSLSDLFEQVRERSSMLRADGAEVLVPDGLETLALDSETGIPAWRRVSHVSRRRYRGNMVEVDLAGNRKLRVTDRHPFLVVEGDQMVLREARDLDPGAQVPLLQGGLDAEEYKANPVLDLLSLLPAKSIDRLHVRVEGVPWKTHAAALKARYGWTIRDSIRRDSLPATRYLEVEDELGLRRSRVTLLSGKGSSHTSFPAMLELTPDFCRFLGYFLSEGCITEEKGNPRVRLTFHRAEKEYMDDVESILRHLGVRISRHDDHKFQATTLRVGSVILARLLSDVLETGFDCYTMRVPDVVMGAPARHREQLLAGVLRGDGDVDVRTGARGYRRGEKWYVHENNTGAVGFFSSSPRLFAQVELLLQEQGFALVRKAGKPHLRVAGTENLRRLALLLGGAKARKLAALENGRKRFTSPRVIRPWKQAAMTTVKQVRAVQGDEYVFSVEVPGLHTFLTSGGVFVHNCIPVDPFYLSWRARAFDSTAAFVELAGRVNVGMPHYVTNRITAAINADKKPLNGSRILVLGVSYKPNVGDIRQSPSLKIMELLGRSGAEIVYHDPHVPHLPEMGLSSVELTKQELARTDCAVISTDHDAVDLRLVVGVAPRVVDLRNAVRRKLGELPSHVDVL